MKHILQLIGLMFICSVLGCYHPRGDSVALEEFRPEIHPEAMGSDGEAVNKIMADHEYRLFPGDSLEILTSGFPEYSGQFTVDDQGNIIFNYENTLVERFYVEGKTEGDLEKELAKKISPTVKVKPKVIVNITGANGRKFYLIGAVSNQGEVPMGRKRVTVLDAIRSSGWNEVHSAITRVHVITPTDVMGQEPQYTKVNVHEMIWHGRLHKNIEVKPGDYVFVPTTYYSQFNILLDYILNPITDQVITWDALQEYTADNKNGLATGGIGLTGPWSK